MKNKNKAVWGTRFSSSTSKVFEKIGASIDIDKRLFEEDILGSIIHAKMLVKQKIIAKDKGNKIIKTLFIINSFNSLNLPIIPQIKNPTNVGLHMVMTFLGNFQLLQWHL